MTLPLETVDKHDGTVDPLATQRNFDKLAQLVAGFGGKSVEIRYGLGTVAFTASATSAATVINHGLGRVVVVALAAEVTTAFGFICRTNTYTATQFSTVATNPFGPGTYTATFGWVAIG